MHRPAERSVVYRHGKNENSARLEQAVNLIQGRLAIRNMLHDIERSDDIEGALERIVLKHGRCKTNRRLACRCLVNRVLTNVNPEPLPVGGQRLQEDAKSASNVENLRRGTLQAIVAPEQIAVKTHLVDGVLAVVVTISEIVIVWTEKIFLNRTRNHDMTPSLRRSNNPSVPTEVLNRRILLFTFRS